MRRSRAHRAPLGLAILLVFTLFVAAGCASVEMESEFRDDGGARHVVEATIEKSALEQLVSFGGGDLSRIFTAREEARRRAEAAGLEYESVDTAQLIGARVSKTVEDASDIGATFDQLFAQAVSGDSGTGDPSTSFNAVSGTFEQDGDRATLNMTIDSDRILGGLAGSGQAPLDQIASFVDITYSATLPGEIIETNGGQVDENTVLWNIPLTGQTEISAVAEGASGESSWLPVVGLLVLLVFLIAAAVYFFVIMQRRRVG